MWVYLQRFTFAVLRCWQVAKKKIKRPFSDTLYFGVRNASIIVVTAVAVSVAAWVISNNAGGATSSSNQNKNPVPTDKVKAAAGGSPFIIHQNVADVGGALARNFQDLQGRQDIPSWDPRRSLHLVPSVPPLTSSIRKNTSTGDSMHGSLLTPAEKNKAWHGRLKHPLDRAVGDHRSPECQGLNFLEEVINSGQKLTVVFVFCNEQIELLLRSIHSVLNRTDPRVLEGIVLVDDGSDSLDIREGGNNFLVDHIATIPKTRLIRMGSRSGIAASRIAGIKASNSDIFVVLDSHIETQPGWAEALIYPIVKDPKNVVMPQIDNINRSTGMPAKGGVGCTLGIIWNATMEHAFYPNESSPAGRREARPHDYVTSPTMAGGLFAANRQYFLDLGTYDEGMLAWGAENVEFSFRIWQCGGRLLCTECSRVYHMFGGGKHYKPITRGSVTQNRLRTAMVWMDEYADLVWHGLGKPKLEVAGDIIARQNLRETLKCKDFRWFLDNVWPESDVLRLPLDVPYMGALKVLSEGNKCIDHGQRGDTKVTINGCSQAKEFMYFKNSKRVMPDNDDETCLQIDTVVAGGLRFDWCHAEQASNQFEVIEMGPPSDQPLNVDLTADKSTYSQTGEAVAVKIINIFSNLCLQWSGESSTAIAAQCNETDPTQLWVWSRYQLQPEFAAKRAILGNVDS